VILVLIPGNTFQMGSERQKVNVKVPPFFLAKYELTKSQLARLTDGRSPNDGLHPAEGMAFYRARGVAAALGLRLPTEAEWEYAARAGTTSTYYWGKIVNEGGKEWANCCFHKHATTKTGSFPPNPFGLYDTAGNVSEWVEDCYEYSRKIPTDGSAWVGGVCDRRIQRGGSYFSAEYQLRSGTHYVKDEDDEGSSAGVRPARTLHRNERSAP